MTLPNGVDQVTIRRNFMTLDRKVDKVASELLTLADGMTAADGLLYRDGYTPTVGQTVFTLTNTPSDTSVEMFVNGVRYRHGIDYTVTGTTVTWLDTLFTLDGSDRVVITYFDPTVLLGGGSIYFPGGWS